MCDYKHFIGEEMPKDKEIRSRGWCFTWNNWTPENRATMESIVCTYIIFGEETAPTTGTPHLRDTSISPTRVP